jgi:hypothetical protein
LEVAARALAERAPPLNARMLAATSLDELRAAEPVLVGPLTVVAMLFDALCPLTAAERQQRPSPALVDNEFADNLMLVRDHYHRQHQRQLRAAAAAAAAASEST